MGVIQTSMISGSTYENLMRVARGDKNDVAMAQMYDSWVAGKGALPDWMGLEPGLFREALRYHFVGMIAPTGTSRGNMDAERDWEREDLRKLLVENRAWQSRSELWVADIVCAASMGSDHLWQDLGLWSRKELTALMERNFPALAARNEHNMKWKKFLYKQMCEGEGIYVCRSPSCEVCVDYTTCFETEE